jgi:hypothetical protein
LVQFVGGHHLVPARDHQKPIAASTALHVTSVADGKREWLNNCVNSSIADRVAAPAIVFKHPLPRDDSGAKNPNGTYRTTFAMHLLCFVNQVRRDKPADPFV